MLFLKIFLKMRKGSFPSTKWKKSNRTKWYLGETLITGIGQGYIQSTPLQLTLMTAQLANGGNKIYPTLIPNNKNIDQIKTEMKITKIMIFLLIIHHW